MSTERAHACFEGRVQGVGFRAHTLRVAETFAVVGHVRNLDDGRVEVVVQGEKGQVDAFLEALGSSLSRYIRHTRVDREHPVEPPPGQFRIAD